MGSLNFLESWSEFSKAVKIDLFMTFQADSFSCWGEKNSETMDVQKLHEVYL